jgi:hypothetical protein
MPGNKNKYIISPDVGVEHTTLGDPPHWKAATQRYASMGLCLGYSVARSCLVHLPCVHILAICYPFIRPRLYIYPLIMLRKVRGRFGDKVSGGTRGSKPNELTDAVEPR